MKRIISKEQAIEICSQWHGGQASALYQFASSGVYLPANNYIAEIRENPITKELEQLTNFFKYKMKEHESR